MTVAQLIEALERIAPLHLAEPWDNVGLLVGDSASAVTRVMLCIDYTPPVAEEARDAKCDFVIAYHPPIFDALKRVTTAPGTRLIHDAIRRGVSVYSPHTALDVAAGGTNDVLADALALIDRRPLKLRENKPTHRKLVTFAPIDAADAVAEAAFAAGGGVIGRYTRCSFRTGGTGTFFGGAGTNPAVGKPGQLERTDEVKLEMVVPVEKTEAIVAAMKQAHPYEEVAFDLQLLAADPTPVGIGRVGKVPGEATVDMLSNMLKRALDLRHLLIAGDPHRLVKRVAVCAGACGGDLLSEAIAHQCDLYITGEMRHHDALRAIRSNMTVLCTLHSNSERATLGRLVARINAVHPSLPVQLSRSDRDPFEMV